jgi:Na+/H+ antiporter NhaD/arsenite permease-like protein
MAFAVGIFALALAAIASERMDRTKVALVGASLMIITQTIDQDEAIAAIDFNTIGLLAGMMLMVKLTVTIGVYTWLAIRAGQISRGRPLAVTASLAVTTAVLSAFLDNLTTVLLVVPITFLLADALDIDPIPLVVIEIVASNIGGTATLIGDPPTSSSPARPACPSAPSSPTWRRLRRSPSSWSRACSTSPTGRA